MKDPYVVLGLERNSAPELLKEKYNQLRALYREQRFKAGEEGNEGARKLQELEEAWIIISAELENVVQTPTGNEYEHVDSLIREGKYNEAQAVLDGITDRHGEWHYLQAIVFYKREWLNDAKNQLEMAVREDPDNAKYRNSLEKLKATIAAPKQGKADGGAKTSTGTVPQEEISQMQQAENMSNCLSSCCCAYCLTDCLCSALRCI